jgi:predicted transcriptional regulator
MKFVAGISSMNAPQKVAALTLLEANLIEIVTEEAVRKVKLTELGNNLIETARKMLQ